MSNYNSGNDSPYNPQTGSYYNPSGQGQQQQNGGGSTVTNDGSFAKETGGNLTTIAASVPGSLGQKTKANSVSVTIASDQGSLGSGGGGSTADLATTGTITAAQPTATSAVTGGTVTLAVGSGQSTWKAELSGTFSSGTTIIAEQTVDGTNWVTGSFTVSGQTTGLVSSLIGGSVPLDITGSCPGSASVRLRCTTFTTGDSINVALHASTGITHVRIAQSLPTGSNTIGTVTVQGSPDLGSTYKYLKTASDGTVVTNSNLQAGTNLAGGVMTYREMVAKTLLGSAKYLTGKVALGTAQSAAISFVDQNGTAYTSVTNGKALYITTIDATCDTNSNDVLQTSLLTLTDGNNLKYQFLASQQSAPRMLPVPVVLSSQSTLTVKAGASNNATPQGFLYVSLVGWEE